VDEAEFFEQRIGTVLRDKWTLEKLLGWGGMAAVYVGRHKIGRRDAIKILHPEMVPKKEIRARFEQEAHAVNRLQHPRAVRILDIDTTEDGAPFLVMELLEGESLLDRLKGAPIPMNDVLRYADELLDVLVAAHDHQIVHRDIKPDNLFILRDGSLKVLDFGIARMREGQPKTIRTRMGVTMGTLSYMPPEQVSGKEIDGRADLFAVGCTLFRVIAGRNPHEGSSDLELMAKMGMQPAPPLRTIAVGAPYEVALIVDRALAFDREHRYPDARTMQEDVRAVRRGAPPPTATRMAFDDPLSNTEVGPLGEAAAAAGPDGVPRSQQPTATSAPRAGGAAVTNVEAPPSSYAPTHLYMSAGFLPGGPAPSAPVPVREHPPSAPLAPAPPSRGPRPGPGESERNPRPHPASIRDARVLGRRLPPPWVLIAAGSVLLAIAIFGTWCALSDDEPEETAAPDPTPTARATTPRPQQQQQQRRRRRRHGPLRDTGRTNDPDKPRGASSSSP
jgi:eukaryotic-like serine/threonine-protein kinase